VRLNDLSFSELRNLPWHAVRALPDVSVVTLVQYAAWHVGRVVLIWWAILSLLHVALSEPFWLLAPWFPELAQWSVPWPARDDWDE
jgi:hypothetical protein